jgi:hypothetical protein
METVAAPGATKIEFYLNMRRRLEDLFSDTDLRPLNWANYRPLWYFAFNGEPLDGIRA